MNYSHTVKARFLDRPNRFVAHVELDGQTETVHVKKHRKMQGASGSRI